MHIENSAISGCKIRDSVTELEDIFGKDGVQIILEYLQRSNILLTRGSSYSKFEIITSLEKLLGKQPSILLAEKIFR